MEKTLIILVTFMVIFTSIQLSAQQTSSFVIIVNPDNPISSLTKVQVADFFLKKTTKWEHGLDVKPVDQAKASPVRAAFSHEVHRKSVEAIDAFWNHKLFSGRDTPPIQQSSDRDIIAYVKANAGSIGYISSASSTNEVKVIRLSD